MNIYYCGSRDRMVVVQSVPIISNVVSSNTVHHELHSIQRNMFKIVCDLCKVGGYP